MAMYLIEGIFKVQINNVNFCVIFMVAMSRVVVLIVVEVTSIIVQLLQNPLNLY